MELTQAQLADTLTISQQLIAAYEAGSRKVPASMLPILARLFAVSLEQLTGLETTPAKRGPASTLQRQIEQIGLMPRSKQKFITEMLEALIKQQQAS
ncbi:helix-turn-helix domain-containing protein [Aliikangiella sp. IMCC44653]